MSFLLILKRIAFKIIVVLKKLYVVYQAIILMLCVVLCLLAILSNCLWLLFYTMKFSRFNENSELSFRSLILSANVIYLTISLPTCQAVFSTFLNIFQCCLNLSCWVTACLVYHHYIDLSSSFFNFFKTFCNVFS